eukprot:3233879-Alexandrium_andersonii.AAC.1
MGACMCPCVHVCAHAGNAVVGQIIWVGAVSRCAVLLGGASVAHCEARRHRTLHDAISKQGFRRKGLTSPALSITSSRPQALSVLRCERLSALDAGGGGRLTPGEAGVVPDIPSPRDGHRRRSVRCCRPPQASPASLTASQESSSATTTA